MPEIGTVSRKDSDSHGHHLSLRLLTASHRKDRRSLSGFALVRIPARPRVTLWNLERKSCKTAFLGSHTLPSNSQKPGAKVIIENWGGPAPLRARVRNVEPYGFTKVSALGIEEQRANVIADFVDSPDGLGDGYRVESRIVIWESPSVLKLPASAVFRVGQSMERICDRERTDSTCPSTGRAA